MNEPSSAHQQERDAEPRRADDPSASSRKVVSVVLIDDNALVREAIATLLNQFFDIRAATTDSDGYSTLIDEAAPDVVLLELDLIHADSIVIARALQRDYPEGRVILMDHVPAGEEIVAFGEAGVCGFIHKGANLNQVLLTIRSVARGLTVLPDPLVNSLVSEIDGATVSRGSGQDSLGLTPREREVLDLIAEGMSNKAIARRLHISIHTVKSHLRNSMVKLSLQSRVELASLVHRHPDVARPDDLSQ